MPLSDAAFSSSAFIMYRGGFDKHTLKLRFLPRKPRQILNPCFPSTAGVSRSSDDVGSAAVLNNLTSF